MATAATEPREWKAVYRFARTSARKARLVVDLVRGRHVNDAIDILRFTDKRAAGLIDKVLRSAMANANEQEADLRRLYVKQAYIDDGAFFKRFRPKDRGRAHRILKRTSHITVVVAERE
jgi:large subunit ribosomal protein L22